MKREELATLVNPLFEVYGRMTVRQVYYQLVSKRLIENSNKSYKAYDSLLTRCREDGQIDPAMFIDGSRPQENYDRYGFTGLEDYVEAIRDDYRRDPLEGQEQQVELWIEKDALRRFVMAGLDLPIPNVATRGYAPFTMLYEAAARSAERPLVILQLGDHDPSGIDIWRNIRETLPGADVVRVALTPEQVEEYNLPPIPTKPGDTRQAGFVEKHGDAAVELDALPPDALVGLAQKAIDQYIDRDQVAHVAELEAAEQERWAGMLQRLEAAL